MRLRYAVIALIVGAFLVAPLAAQTGGGQRPTGRSVARPTSAQVVVRDTDGTPLESVRITIAGDTANQSLTTDRNGTATAMLTAGSYRLRFDRDGFVSLERDVTIRTAQQAPIEVWLKLAPPPPEPPPPPPPPPVVVTAPPPAQQGATGPPVTVSIPDFLDKNFIGRDPLKESILGCTSGATTRLLQLRNSLAMHAHADLDEMLYVVAGEGAIRADERMTTVTPGSLMVIPRGAQHAIERGGKNPLVLLSTLAGAPCPQFPQGSPSSRPK